MDADLYRPEIRSTDSRLDLVSFSLSIVLDRNDTYKNCSLNMPVSSYLTVSNILKHIIGGSILWKCKQQYVMKTDSLEIYIHSYWSSVLTCLLKKSYIHA